MFLFHNFSVYEPPSGHVFWQNSTKKMQMILILSQNAMNYYTVDISTKKRIWYINTIIVEFIFLTTQTILILILVQSA